MNRKRWASVEFEIKIFHGKGAVQNEVFCRIKNTSSVFAEHAAFSVRVPAFINGDYIRFPENARLQIDSNGFTNWVISQRLGPLDVPIPSCAKRWQTVRYPRPLWKSNLSTLVRVVLPSLAEL